MLNIYKYPLKKCYKTLSLSIIALLALIIFAKPSFASTFYHDWVLHWLWVNGDTQNSRDFQIVIYPVHDSNGTPDVEFVTSQLVAYPVGGNAILAGIIADGTGVKWYAAISDGTVTCFPNGESGWGGKGCFGDYDDHVAVGQWSRFELVNYHQGFWIARVWDQNNNPIDIAKLHISEASISSIAATGGQAYSSSNVELEMHFSFYNPQYMKWGTGFQDWPAATGDYQNWVDTITNAPNNTVCPPYRYNASPNNLRWWYKGDQATSYYCFKKKTF